VVSDKTLLAGAAEVEINPKKSMFLFGYPNVPRWSTGVHDPLLASALFLSDGTTAALMIGVDIVSISKSSTQRVRERIASRTSLPARHIMISATHTHSGPMTGDYLSNEHDKVVPKTEPEYVQFFEDQLVEAGCRAVANAEPARMGFARADATGIGTNRRDPSGPADLSVPVFMVQRRSDRSPLAIMLICCMHPTVLHEDSTLISGDFPGLARAYLKKHVVGAGCPVLYHTGPAGNQSPRHVVKGQTFDEAKRLGEIVGKGVEKSLANMTFVDNATIECAVREVTMPLRGFPSAQDAEKKLAASVKRLEDLRKANAPRADVRTAECDWFGAGETLTLAKAAADGRLQAAAATCMPAEVQLIRVGQWNFVAWQGEIFIEFALSIKARCPNTFIISYANGDVQGYLVTQQAVDEGGYEASNALFKSPDGGNLLVDATLDLLR
jgi:hypothetical protein